MRMPWRDERGELSILLAIIFVVIVVVFGGYKLIGVAADYMAEHISDETEASLFASLSSQPGWRPSPTTEQHKRAQAVFEKLRQSDELRDLKYKMHYVADSTPNAFALPGGAMAVTDGLLDLVESDIGLAMVIGHEFGHQQYRHSLKMMGRSLLLAGTMMLLVGDAGFLVGLAVNLAENSHSRDQEIEADEYGIHMVHHAFGTTDGALEFFEKIGKEGGKTDQVLSMLSTHPYTPDRIERLQAIIAKLPEKSPVPSRKPNGRKNQGNAGGTAKP